MFESAALKAIWEVFKKIWPFIALGLLLMAAAYWYHGKISDAREVGAKSVQTLWDKDKEHRIQLASNLALLYAHQLDINEQNALKAQEELRHATTQFEERLKTLPTNRTIFLSADTSSVLDDAFRFANGGSADSSATSVPPGGASTVPATTAPPAGYISEQEHAAFVTAASVAYRSAVGMFHDVRKRYNDVVAAQQEVMKGEKQ